jgi:hypothetical protein
MSVEQDDTGSLPLPAKDISNWTTTIDGNILESQIKIYLLDEGLYDIECDRASLSGLQFEMEIKLEKVIVKCINETSSNMKVRNIVCIGDILLQINGRNVLDEEFDDVFGLLEMLEQSELPVKYKFLNPKRMSFEHYVQQLALQTKLDKDLYGFTRTTEYLIAEKDYLNSHRHVLLHRDMEWVEYLKAIGGPENLKPAGQFKPSNDLKTMCRRGIPAAFRPLVWQKISLCNNYRKQHPEKYYKSLLVRVLNNELPQRVMNTIEKDVDR